MSTPDKKESLRKLCESRATELDRNEAEMAALRITWERLEEERKRLVQSLIDATKALRKEALDPYEDVFAKTRNHAPWEMR